MSRLFLPQRIWPGVIASVMTTNFPESLRSLIPVGRMGTAILLPLAKLPNVAIKATGAPGYSAEQYPFRDIHDGLRRIYDAYGPDRFFWGTDITRMPCTYRQCVTHADLDPYCNSHSDCHCNGDFNSDINAYGDCDGYATAHSDTQV